MTEKALWTTVKDAIGHIGHFDRIESHAVTQGRPDVNYCISGVTGDVELKVFDKRKGGFVLRANQNAWFCNRNKAGAKTIFILARYDNEYGNKTYLLIHGSKSRELIHDRSYDGWEQQATMKWFGVPDWVQLRNALLGMD